MFVRSQESRQWIYLELKPEGQNTGGIYIDLNMVDKVSVVFKDGDTAEALEILYAGQMKPIQIRNWPEYDCNSASWFYNVWTTYLKDKQNLRDKMAPAKPGLLVSGNTGILKL